MISLLQNAKTCWVYLSTLVHLGLWLTSRGSKVPSSRSNTGQNIMVESNSRMKPGPQEAAYSAALFKLHGKTTSI
jgi:hypothetical protein